MDIRVDVVNIGKQQAGEKVMEYNPVQPAEKGFIRRPDRADKVSQGQVDKKWKNRIQCDKKSIHSYISVRLSFGKPPDSGRDNLPVMFPDTRIFGKVHRRLRRAHLDGDAGNGILPALEPVLQTSRRHAAGLYIIS